MVVLQTNLRIFAEPSHLFSAKYASTMNVTVVLENLFMEKGNFGGQNFSILPKLTY